MSEVVARNVRRIREAKNVTQAALAAQLAAQTGERWDDSMVSKVESNRRRLTLDELIALALVFSVNPLDLLTHKGNEQIRVGASVMPRRVFHQAVLVFPGLEAKLRRHVAEGRFSGWVTVERLVAAGFSDWEAKALAGDDFHEWAYGPEPDVPRTRSLTGKPLTQEELSEPAVAEPFYDDEGDDDE